MTIAVTLNHVHHSNSSSHRGSYGCNSSSNNSDYMNNSLMASSSSKVRPYRKFQEYRDNSRHCYVNYQHNHFQCQPQHRMLSNGYANVPLLSLQNALRQQRSDNTMMQLQQHFNCNETEHHHKTHQERGRQYQTMMFPSLTPGITTVIPSLASSSLASDVLGYIASEESSSYSSSSSNHSNSANVEEDTRYQVQRLLQQSFQSQSLFEDSHVKNHRQLAQRSLPKLVRFAPTATMHTLPPVSDDDLYQRWYQADDYMAFECDNRQIVLYINDMLKQYCHTKDLSKVSMDMKNKYLMNIMQNDVLTTNNDNLLLSYQILGLEQFIYGQKYMIERRQETIHHNHMVLEMYDVQRTTQHYNPNVLRRVSERFSYPKVERAIRRATDGTATTYTSPATITTTTPVSCMTTNANTTKSSLKAAAIAA